MMTYAFRKLVLQHSLIVEPITDNVYEEGCYYYNGYWEEFYRVLAVKSKNNELLGVVVEFENGRIISHCTSLDKKWDYKIISNIEHLFNNERR